MIEMQSSDNPPTIPFPLSPLLLLNAVGGGAGDFGDGGFELSRYLFLGSLLFSREGGGMDLSKVGEKIFSSVRSACSLGLLPSPSDRPENGRRHLTSSRNEVSRDLIVTENSKKKQVLLNMLPTLSELRHAVDMQVALDTCVEEGNFSKAFQVLPEYLQVLDSLSDLSSVQEMSLGVEVWLGKTSEVGFTSIRTRSMPGVQRGWLSHC